MTSLLHSVTDALRHLFPSSRTPSSAALALLEETHAERMETDAVLHTVTSVAAPRDLPLRLRVALSHERVRAERRWTGRLAHRWHLLQENTFRPLAVQGAGLLAATLLVASGIAIFGALTPQQAVEANDIPLIGFSAPRYLYSSSGLHQPIASADEAPVIVEAKVNAAGRVYDYRVLSGTIDAVAVRALRERMLSSVFRPARVLGEPVRGKVVLTFADIEVHG